MSIFKVEYSLAIPNVDQSKFAFNSTVSKHQLSYNVQNKLIPLDGDQWTTG